VGPDHFPKVEVTSREELRDWLVRHHGRDEAIWLVTFRKAVADRYVPHEAVMDELIAFGWIDGIRRRVDDERTMQLVSPRRTQPWARSYRVRAERLIAEGRMQSSGLASVERAKATGMWEAMADVDDLVVPDDLAAALEAAPLAAAYFDAFPPSTRRNILRWIASAKTPPTREKRIALTVQDAQRNVRVRSNG
jgi:uncharacterized protein YdeI (YjbR/CyaY-like superfamily)